MNVLVITVDTLRADRLGCYGYDRPISPYIDGLAATGVRFDKVVCQAPLTLPSHCSIFTSRHTISHGSLGHAYPLDEGIETLAEILKAEGLNTAAFVSNHVLDKKFGLARGFDTYWQAHNRRMDERQEMKARSRDVTTEAAVSWLRDQGKKPFFLWIHWFHPHKPYTPPPEYARRFAGGSTVGQEWKSSDLMEVWQGSREIPPEDVDSLRQLYDAEVAFSDSQVGIVLEELKRLGMSDNTLVVFTSDHGEVLYEHDRYFGHDIMLYEPSMRIPLVLSYPEWKPGVVSGLVQSIDIMPTVLEILGLETSAQLEGKSLAPLVHGEDSCTVQIAMCLSYPPKKKSLPIFGTRTETWKLILHELEDGAFRRELFNLDEDPGETRNRSEDEADLADAMEAYYLRWTETIGGGTTAEPELDPETLENLRSLGYIQ
jgi:arylsulfatase A-like enzyme